MFKKTPLFSDMIQSLFHGISSDFLSGSLLHFYLIFLCWQVLQQLNNLYADFMKLLQ